MNGMQKSFVMEAVVKKYLMLVFVFIALTSNARALDYSSWTYRQDFENKELNAWSSYPPIQDTAYEAPFIYPAKAIPADTGTSLCKIMYPKSANPQLTGVVKKLNMRLDEKSSISFRYYIKTTVQPSLLYVDLTLADGGRIKNLFPNPQINGWQKLNLKYEDIADTKGTGSDAVLDVAALAVYARFETCDPDMPILFALDDVIVNGSRPVAFAYSTPKTASLDEWDSDIALTHYRYSDKLEIAGSFGDSQLSRIDAVIERFDRPGKTVKSFKLFKDGVSWSTKKGLTLDKNNFPAGMYSVALTGTNGREVAARSKFTFMIIDDAMTNTHPGYWFTKDTVADYKLRLETKFPEFLEYIRHEAEDARSRYSNELPNDLHYFPKVGWLKSFEGYRTRIGTIPTRTFANALVYALDGDMEAAEWAKTALVNHCKWPTWTHPFMKNRGHHIYLYVSYTTRELAMAYDILHELLTEEERETVRAAFIRNGLIPTYKSYVVADMVTNNESNWITAVVGGSLLAGCSILGDLEDSSSLEPWLSGCIYKLNAHMRTVYSGDSGFIEGFSYGLGTMRHYSEILPLFRKTLGLDFEPMFAEDYDEVLWAGDHYKGMYFTFGDAHWTGGNSFAAFPWLMENFKDQELAWLYERNKTIPAPYTLQTPQFKVDDVIPKKPELTGSKLFETTGTAIFRSGNEPDSFIFTYRCGPFGNHQHIDQGSFYLHDRAETLVTELGYSSYYDDPFYQSHVIQPVGHNCILIDGNIHSQRVGDHGFYAAGMNERASMPEFVGGQSLAYASGDLGPVYLGNVKTLTRGALYLAPRTVLLLDRLETESGEAEMSALFHGPKYAEMSMAGESLDIGSGVQNLSVLPIYSEAVGINIEPEIVTLAHYTDDLIEPLGRASVTMKTKGGKALNATLMSTDLDILDSSEVRGSTYLKLKDGHVLVNPAHEMLSNGPIGTDGVLAAATDAGAFLVVEGTHGSFKSRRVLHSDQPVTMLLEGDTVHYSTGSETVIHVSAVKKVGSVILNGKALKGWKRDRKTGVLSVTVPEGRGSFEMR